MNRTILLLLLLFSFGVVATTPKIFKESNHQQQLVTARTMKSNR